MKNLQRVALVLFAIIALAGLVSALPVNIESVKVNDVTLQANAVNSLDVKRANDLDVRIVVSSTEDLDNVQVQGDIAGYEYNNDVTERLSDVNFVGEMSKDVLYPVDLTIPLSKDVQVDSYKLTLTIRDRNGEPTTQSYNLKIDTARHSVEFTDVSFTPSDKVKAGQAVLARVRVENKGQVVENDVKVTVSIPELNVKQSAFINKIKNNDDQEQTEEIYLRIPQCAEPKVYDVQTAIEYSNGRASESKVQQIEVTKNDLCEKANSMLQVNIGSQLQNVHINGDSAQFPITLVNQGTSMQAYTLSVTAPQGVNVQVTPSTALAVGAGQSQNVFVFASADNTAAVGPQVITAQIMSGSDVVQQLSFTLNVEAQAKSAVRMILEVLLILLVVVLVVLGLVIGFSRLRNNGKSEPYY